MFFKRLVILIFVVLIGSAAGWGVRRVWRVLHPEPVRRQAQPVDSVSPGQAAPSAVPSLSAAPAAAAPEVPPYVVGVTIVGGRVTVAWSNGDREGEDDFALAGKSLRVTRGAVWIAGERFPVLPRKVDVAATSVVGAASVGVLGASVVPSGGVEPSVVDDDPTWAYSRATGVWYLRDRSSVIGAQSK